MKFNKTSETDIFLFENLSKFNNLTHFVSTNVRKEGKRTSHDFNISLESGDDTEKVILNRNSLSKAIDIPIENFVMQNQVHGNNVKIITEEEKGKGIFNHSDSVQDNDAMITNKPNICLFLFAADCVPILFYDSNKHIIGAAHSGWQGTVKKIAQKTALKMQEVYNSSLKDIIVSIGPSISLKNYEIGENVLTAGKNAFGTIEDYFFYNKKSGKYHFDLWYANKQQLIDIGLIESKIEISNMCTFDRSDIFFSARKNNTGRFAAGIMLKN